MLAAALLAAAAPQPGALKTFGDWTVGCDNGRVCQAVALLPEDGADGATLAVLRGAEAGAVPDVWVTVRVEGMQSPEALVIDGTSFPLVLDRQTETLRVRDGAGAARMLGQAITIVALGPGGDGRAQVSTKGSAAALLYMDEQQRRLDTATALVRRGPKPASAVPPPPALPLVDEVRAGGVAPGFRLARARIGHLRKAGGCDPAMDLADFRPEARRLDARTMLVLIPCWLAAYNGSSLVLVGRKTNGSDLVPARFDHKGTPEGAYWDEEKGRLASFFKGRGLGDCGSGQEWAWDGQRFRLVRAEAMGECRGSTDYITTWRANTR